MWIILVKENWRKNMNNNTPVYDYEDAINFISEKCDISRDTIEKILMLEEDYMRSIGIIVDEKEQLL